MQDRIKVTGYVTIIDNNTGKVIHEGNNLVTSLGQDMIADLISGFGNPPQGMAIGSDGTTPDKAQTALLGTEHERVLIDIDVTNNVLVMTGIFGTGLGGNVTIQEIGIFDDEVSGGIMFARFTCNSFSMGPTSTATVTWQLTIGG